MRHRTPLSSPSPRGHQTLRPAAAGGSPLTPPSGKNDAYRTTKAIIAKTKPAALVKTGLRQPNEWFSKLTECADTRACIRAFHPGHTESDHLRRSKPLTCKASLGTLRPTYQS